MSQSDQTKDDTTKENIEVEKQESGSERVNNKVDAINTNGDKTANDPSLNKDSPGRDEFQEVQNLIRVVLALVVHR